MPVVPALGSLRQEDHKFRVSLSYIVRPPCSKVECLKWERDP